MRGAAYRNEPLFYSALVTHGSGRYDMPAHEGDDVADHLIVVLNVRAIRIQSGISIKGHQLQELR